MSAKRDDWALCCAEIEVQHLMGRLDALYAAQLRGDRSAITADKVRRLEALQMAMAGFVDEFVAVSREERPRM